MKSILKLGVLLVFALTLTLPMNAQKMDASTFSGLKFRNVGPAFTSGRIADIAIHPKNENVWYVAVGSGGVWKTSNSGTTWKPIFDGQKSYSIGAITIDPSNPFVLQPIQQQISCDRKHKDQLNDIGWGN